MLTAIDRDDRPGYSARRIAYKKGGKTAYIFDRDQGLSLIHI